jgi:hypothetical protein
MPNTPSQGAQQILKNLKKKHGGARSGAGMKSGTKTKKTIEKEAAQQAIYDWVMERLDDILEGLYQRAVGCEVEKNTAQGVKIFSEPPNPEAAKILIEHAIGKPQAKIIHSGDAESPLGVLLYPTKKNVGE